MAIGHFIKEIGRGKEGARALSREQAADLWGQLLDGRVSDLELGAFCLAMRIKGETPDEMCGFLDATQERLNYVQVIPTNTSRPAVVIPSYNGARKLPVLTPLLALLLAREGFPVVIHGTSTEDRRVGCAEVLTALGHTNPPHGQALAAGQVAFVPTAWLHPGLQRLLDVRRTVQLRNPAHSLVKLLAPCHGRQILVTSYTHPEYAVSMQAVLGQMEHTALLLRGTEGEAYADPRRAPRMHSLERGRLLEVHAPQEGSLLALPELPAQCDAASTATYIHQVLDGVLPLPAPLALQVARIRALAEAP